MIITMRDVRAAKMCSRGARLFFKRYGLDWSQFIASGVESSVIEETGDAMGLKVVEVALERRGR